MSEATTYTKLKKQSNHRHLKKNNVVASHGGVHNLSAKNNYVASHKGVHLFQLDNGFRVAYDFSTQGERVEILLVCPAGSAFELQDNQKGIRHVGEHMFFATALYIWAKSAGANLNAKTSQNECTITCTCDVSKIPDMLNFMRDTLAGKHMESMTQMDIDKEKPNVLTEKRIGSNDPMRIVLTEFNKDLVRVGNSDPTIGYEDTIKNATRETVLNLFKQTTGPRNCTLIFVGPPAQGYNVSSFVDSTNELFSSVPNNPMLRKLEPYRERKHSGVQINNIRRNLGGTVIGFGWPSPSAGQENMTLQVIMELLTMKNGLLEPLKENPMPNNLGTLIGDAMTQVNAFNYPDTMVMIASVPCSPRTEAFKVNFASMALMQTISSLATFDNQTMLDTALNKIKRRYAIMSETLEGRANLIERGVLASNLDNCQPWWFLDYETAFSDKVINIDSVRNVSAGYLNQNSLVTVNLLQNELYKGKSCDNVTPMKFMLDKNSDVELNAETMALLKPEAFERDNTGICLTQQLLPSSCCVSMFNYHIPSHSSSWAVRKVVAQLFNDCGKGLERASAKNIQIVWESNFNDIVATVMCDKRDVDEAHKLYRTMLFKSKFTPENVFQVMGKMYSYTQSIKHNTKKQCEVAVLSDLFNKNSPMYARTEKEQIESISKVNGGDIQRLIKRIRAAPTQVGTINFSRKKRNEIITNTCKNVVRSSPANFDQDAEISDPDVAFIPVKSSDSYTLKIGQPLRNVSGDDIETLSKLVVANKIMSNSFNGRLMKKLRTEQSLTYGISSLIESRGTDPVMLMTAAFSPENIKKGMQEARKVLNDFCSGNFTKQEFELAKTTAVSIYRTYGTDMAYAESKLKKMLSVDNPYEIDIDIDTINSCSYDEVKRLIKTSMNADDFKLVYSGPKEIQ